MRRATHGPGTDDLARAATTPPVLQSLVTEVEEERARLADLAALHVMDTAEETAYNDLTRMAADICGAPVALISLVDSERQWFKARVGTDMKQTPREHAFCAHVMVVRDTLLDGRFVANPLVTGDPHIRFYAGAPLVTDTGHALGTLCVIAPTPRDIDPKQLEMLQFLADQVMQRMEKGRTDP